MIRSLIYVVFLGLFTQKFLSLKVIHEVFDHCKTILEFYVNFDCKLEQSNIIEKIIEILSKISKGKYLNNEQFLLRPNEEILLRTISLESLIRLLEKFVENIENDCNNTLQQPNILYSDVKESTIFEEIEEMSMSRKNDGIYYTKEINKYIF